MKKALFGSALFTFLVFLFAVMPTPAQAQVFPCPNGPGPNERIVGYDNVSRVQLCTSDGTAPVPVLNDYATIAWHHDYDQVWFGGGFKNRGESPQQVLNMCNQATGGGCTMIPDFGNSYTAIVRTNLGSLYQGWGLSGNAAKDAALKACNPQQPLPCEIVKVYKSWDWGYQRPKKLDAARKRYLATATAMGDRYDRKTWIATGQLTVQAANDAAISACQKANPGATCKIWGNAVGNGVFQMFTTTSGKDGGEAERTVDRAKKALQLSCKKQKDTCTAQAFYSSLQKSIIQHDFKTGLGTTQ
jgi:Domain of unknown function (DUF4189)